MYQYVTEHARVRRADTPSILCPCNCLGIENIVCGIILEEDSHSARVGYKWFSVSNKGTREESKRMREIERRNFYGA